MVKPTLTEVFAAVMETKNPDDGGNGDQPQEEMTYKQFDRFLSSVKTTQVGGLCDGRDGKWGGMEGWLCGLVEVNGTVLGVCSPIFA